MGDGQDHFRRTARRPVELRVRFRDDDAEATFERHGELVDLGLGGAQVRCTRPPLPGTRLQLVLVAPSAWDPLELPGEVRWSTGAGLDGIFGMAFLHLSGLQASALRELLSVTPFAEPEP
ncbi:MAG: PilZ domain-containing protein [Sandaracinaceae bacterium]